MFDNWALVYSTPHFYETEIIKSIMAENDIECISMNKKDSAYLFGDIEVYVPKGEALRAKQLIPDFKSE